MNARDVVLAAALAALPGCATVEVAVAPGHGAVALDERGGYTRLDEGVAALPARAHVDDFELREQTVGGSFAALTADGVPLVVADPVVGYRLAAGELVALDRELGADGVRPLVARVVQSIVGEVLAHARWDALDPAHIRAAQAEIVERARAALAPHHILVDSVELKGLVPRLPARARAVTATGIWAERAAAAKTRVDVARARADRLRARADGIAAANRAIAPTLDAAVLAQQRDAAWARLVAAPNSAVQVSTESSTTVEVAP